MAGIIPKASGGKEEEVAGRMTCQGFRVFGPLSSHASADTSCSFRSTFQLPAYMHRTRPETFPQLPPHPSGDTWSSVISEAHRVLSTAYHDSAALLRFEDGDPLRLHLYATQILKRKVPILQALEREVSNPAWIATCAEALGILVRDLLDEAANADAV